MAGISYQYINTTITNNITKGDIAQTILSKAKQLKISSEYVGAVMDIINSLSNVVSLNGTSFLRYCNHHYIIIIIFITLIILLAKAKV
jgi:hypothetical protein